MVRSNSNLTNKTTFPNADGFYPDIKDGKYGFNTSAERGADTFIPFKSTLGIKLTAFSGRANHVDGTGFRNWSSTSASEAISVSGQNANVLVSGDYNITLYVGDTTNQIYSVWVNDTKKLTVRGISSDNIDVSLNVGDVIKISRDNTQGSADYGTCTVQMYL